MPFKSEKQRRYLWMHEPAIAKKWAHKYGSAVSRSNLKSAARSRIKSPPVGKKNA